MRSHVTSMEVTTREKLVPFQYRKRYEVTCDFVKVDGKIVCMRFQYRKRYEVTCDACSLVHDGHLDGVSIPQAV